MLLLLNQATASDWIDEIPIINDLYYSSVGISNPDIQAIYNQMLVIEELLTQILVYTALTFGIILVALVFNLLFNMITKNTI